MRATFQNTGMVLSIGVFFSLMIVGLASTMPAAMSDGLERNGVPPAVATQVSEEPPVGTLFAAFLGYNPMEKLIPADTLSSLTPEQRDEITGKTFFPELISDPFIDGLRIAFTSSVIMMLIAAWASWMRGPSINLDEETLAFGAPRDDDADATPMEDEWVPA
jgi:hypothetical protein